jgi:hypothetical protein
MMRILASLVLGFTLTVHAAGENNVDSSGLALKGYDPVAYFTENKPVKGNTEFSARHAFAAAPAKYSPQYGGYCAFGVASGYKAPIEPDAWTVVDGKLYLNYNQSVRRQWSGDIPGYLRKADANWPQVRSK